MKYRTLGRTGISFSEIGFGSHVAWDKLDDEEGRTAQIRKGLELGITSLTFTNTATASLA